MKVSIEAIRQDDKVHASYALTHAIDYIGEEDNFGEQWNYWFGLKCLVLVSRSRKSVYCSQAYDPISS